MTGGGRHKKADSNSSLPRKSESEIWCTDERSCYFRLRAAKERDIFLPNPFEIYCRTPKWSLLSISCSFLYSESSYSNRLPFSFAVFLICHRSNHTFTSPQYSYYDSRFYFIFTVNDCQPTAFYFYRINYKIFIDRFILQSKTWFPWLYRGIKVFLVVFACVCFFRAT